MKPTYLGQALKSSSRTRFTHAIIWPNDTVVRLYPCNGNKPNDAENPLKIVYTCCICVWISKVLGVNARIPSHTHTHAPWDFRRQVKLINEQTCTRQIVFVMNIHVVDLHWIRVVGRFVCLVLVIWCDFNDSFHTLYKCIWTMWLPFNFYEIRYASNHTQIHTNFFSQHEKTHTHTKASCCYLSQKITDIHNVMPSSCHFWLVFPRRYSSSLRNKVFCVDNRNEAIVLVGKTHATLLYTYIYHITKSTSLRRPHECAMARYKTGTKQISNDTKFTSVYDLCMDQTRRLSLACR